MQICDKTFVSYNQGRTSIFKWDVDRSRDWFAVTFWATFRKITKAVTWWTITTVHCYWLAVQGSPEAAELVDSSYSPLWRKKYMETRGITFTFPLECISCFYWSRGALMGFRGPYGSSSVSKYYLFYRIEIETQNTYEKNSSLMMFIWHPDGGGVRVQSTR